MRGRYCDVVSLDASQHGQQLHAAYSEADDAGDWTYLPYGPFPDASQFAAWLATVEHRPDPVFYAIIDLAT